MWFRITYLVVWLLIYMLTYLLTYLLAYVLTYSPTHLLTYYVLTVLPAQWRALDRLLNHTELLCMISFMFVEFHGSATNVSE